MWPPPKLESLPLALVGSLADPSQVWSLNQSTPCGRSRSEGCKPSRATPSSWTSGEELPPGASGLGPLRFPPREGAAAEPAAAVGNHTPQPAGARGLGEGERINYFLGAGLLHSFHSQSMASPRGRVPHSGVGVGSQPQKSQRTCIKGYVRQTPA